VWRKFETSADIIGYEQAILISERNPNPPGPPLTPYEYTGFNNKDIPSWGRSWASVNFYHAAVILSTTKW
jgi:hypothetical protein